MDNPDKNGQLVALFRRLPHRVILSDLLRCNRLLILLAVAAGLLAQTNGVLSAEESQINLTQIRHYHSLWRTLYLIAGSPRATHHLALVPYLGEIRS
jgi:hypothetical protein